MAPCSRRSAESELSLSLSKWTQDGGSSVSGRVAGSRTPAQVCQAEGDALLFNTLWPVSSASLIFEQSMSFGERVRERVSAPSVENRLECNEKDVVFPLTGGINCAPEIVQS
jgi:hypothetical protein